VVLASDLLEHLERTESEKLLTTMEGSLLAARDPRRDMSGNVQLGGSPVDSTDQGERLMRCQDAATS
jgi:hypothetical protein